MIRRIFAICAASAVPLTLAAGSGAHAGGITRLCGIGFTSPTPTQCFSPKKVALVERQLAVHPIRPSAVVVPETHLRLRRLALFDIPRPDALQYLYGGIPRAVNGLPAFALPSPRYVLVTERIDSSPSARPRLVNADGHPKYMAHFRCHALTLTVDSNLSPRATSRLGKGVLALERCSSN